MIKNQLTCLFLAGALLAACSDDDTPAADAKAYPLVIQAKVYDYGTGQEGKTWTNAQDNIGVYVLKGGSHEVVSPHANLRYYPTPTSYDDYFQPGDVNAIPYFPPAGEDVWDVTLYYPYQEALATEATVPLQLDKQGSLKSSSLLYARAASLDKDNRTASLRLAPALSRLLFNFRVKGYVTAADLTHNEGGSKRLNAKLNGVPKAGSFNILTGRFTATEETTPPSFGMKIRVPEAATAEDPTVAITAEAFVMPLGSTQGYVTEISIPNLGKTYKYPISRDIGSLSRGMQYTFDVTIGDSGFDVETTSSPITGWEEGDSIVGEGEEMAP